MQTMSPGVGAPGWGVVSRGGEALSPVFVTTVFCRFVSFPTCSANEEGSDADYHAGSDSDADYVPDGKGTRVGVVSRGGGGGGGSSQSDTGSIGDPDNPKK